MGTPGWRDRYYSKKFNFNLPEDNQKIDQACDEYAMHCLR